MLGQPQPYLINLKNLRPEDLELAGREAVQSSFLHTNSIPTPSAFVITSRSFDDFLTATQLVEPILNLISNTTLENAQQMSKEIQDLIIKTNIPSIIERPLLEAYKNLGNNGNLPFVTLEPSTIIKSEFIPFSSHHHTAINIYGEESFIAEVKRSWAELFSYDAIKLRIEKGYEGVLTTALIVQKMIRPEISGIVYSKKEDFDKYIYIEAIYGLEDLSKPVDHKDIFKVDIENMGVVEKSITQQTTMLVRKGKVRVGDNPNMTVNISTSLQSLQKIDDERILQLASLTLKINEYLKNKFELSWGIEAGEINIFNLHDLDLIKQRPNINNKNVKTKKEDELTSQVTNVSIAKTEVETVIEDKAIDANTNKLITAFEPQIETIQNLTPNTLLTKIFVNTGSMQSNTLAMASTMKGAYISGTDLLVKTLKTPDNSKDKTEISSITNSLSFQLNTVAQMLEGNELIYSLSSFTEKDFRLLDLDEAFSKYTHDERFLHNEELLTPEIMAVKKSRNESKLKNISLSIPGIRSYDSLLKLKRIVSSEGLRRSASFKVYAEISMPSFIYQLDLIEADDIDGIIIDFDNLSLNSFVKNNPTEEDSLSLIKALIKWKPILKSKNILLIIKMQSRPSIKILKEIMNLQPSGLIVDFTLDDEILNTIEKSEREFFENMLIPLKKRGRKTKNLF